MSSSRNVTTRQPDRILDAAASCARATGSRRIAISDVARAARVSRPTVYRYFADSEDMVRALWERELSRLVVDVPTSPSGRSHFVSQVVTIADAVSRDDALVATFGAEPALLTRYIVERLGAGQRVVRARLRVAIAALQARPRQRGGGVRQGDPDELATMTLLIVQSAVQSRRMTADGLPGDAWARELVRALDGYLKP